jgi:hypothetical protein
MCNERLFFHFIQFFEQFIGIVFRFDFEQEFTWLGRIDIGDGRICNAQDRYVFGTDFVYWQLLFQCHIEKYVACVLKKKVLL